MQVSGNEPIEKFLRRHPGLQELVDKGIVLWVGYQNAGLETVPAVLLANDLRLKYNFDYIGWEHKDPADECRSCWTRKYTARLFIKQKGNELLWHLRGSQPDSGKQFDRLTEAERKEFSIEAQVKNRNFELRKLKTIGDMVQHVPGALEHLRNGDEHGIAESIHTLREQGR